MPKAQLISFNDINRKSHCKCNRHLFIRRLPLLIISRKQGHLKAFRTL